MKNLYITIIAALVLLLAGGGYFYLTYDPPPKCQKEVISFDKISDNSTLLKRAKEALANQSISYRTKIYESKHMKSVVKSYIDADRLRELSENIFGKSSENSNLKILCELYENDREDPGKKSQNCKIFAGYLLYTFYLDGEQFYKMQIDVTEGDYGDLPKRLECIKKSLDWALER